MHNFRKVLLSLIGVFLIFFVLSSLVLEPYLLSEAKYYQDRRLRESLAGEIDFISVGASNGLCALDAQVVDQELGCFSYNLSGSLMTLNASKFLLEKELKRNPIETVIIDLSYETLIRASADEHGEGDSITYARLSSLPERLKFLATCVPLNDWLSIYAYHFFPAALEYLLSSLHGDLSAYQNVNYEAKGLLARKAADLELNAEEAKVRYNEKLLNTNFREQNIRRLISLIRLCKEYDVRIILATFPRSDASIWSVYGQDDFYQWAQDFAREQNCEFYDMNLLKDRYILFNDRVSFYDDQHMSDEGAAVFTKAFCDIIQKGETEDVSQSFYDSYEAMKADSPYMQYLK